MVTLGTRDKILLQEEGGREYKKSKLPFFLSFFQITLRILLKFSGTTQNNFR